MTREELDEAASTAYRLGGREALPELWAKHGVFTCPLCKGTGLLPEDVRRRHRASEGGVCSCACAVCIDGEYGREHLAPIEPFAQERAHAATSALVTAVHTGQQQGASRPVEGYGFNIRALKSFKMTECNIAKVLQVAREEVVKLKPDDPTRKQIEGMIALCEATGFDRS